MKGNPIRIPLDLLDENPGPYTMSFGFDPRPLMESIRKIGLLNPPLVECTENGKIHIIAGYRRILALKALKEQEVACFDLSGSKPNASESLLLNLYDNLAFREFNDPEKAMALERLVVHFTEEEVVGLYMPLLGLPSHRPLLSTYLRVGELDKDIRVALAHKRISFQTIRAFLEMGPESKSALFKWFSEIIFNVNQQAQFIELCDDLSSQLEISIPRLLSRSELTEIMEDEDLNGPQKVKSAIERLRAMRFPKLLHAERRFQKIIGDLRLPEGVSVHHSPFFEAPDYRLEVRFREGEALRNKILELSGIALDRFKDPWEEQ